MGSLPKTEGYTSFIKGIKCYKLFCRRTPVYRKMVIKFPVIARYRPACEKHK